MIYDGVCRTALATPGLLTNKDYQRMMMDPMFMIVQNTRLFLTAIKCCRTNCGYFVNFGNYPIIQTYSHIVNDFSQVLAHLCNCVHMYLSNGVPVYLCTGLLVYLCICGHE